MYLEKARLIHDAFLWIMAGSMLLWAITLWRAGTITPGDVVIISALTFRILHGSRDLALALVNTSQHFGIITDSLAVIAQPHGLEDVGDEPAAAAGRRCDRVQGRFVPLSGRAAGLRTVQPEDRAGAEGRACRTVGLRQIDADQPDPAPGRRRRAAASSSMVSGSRMSVRTACARGSPSCLRKSPCSTARSWKTSATAGRMRPTRK